MNIETSVLLGLIGLVALVWSLWGVKTLIAKLRQTKEAAHSQAHVNHSGRHEIDPPAPPPKVWQIAIVYLFIGLATAVLLGGFMVGALFLLPSFPYKWTLHVTALFVAVLACIAVNAWLWVGSHGLVKPFRAVVTVDKYFNWLLPLYLLVGHRGGLMRVRTAHGSHDKVSVYWKWRWEKPEYTVDIEGTTRIREYLVRTHDGGEFKIHVTYRETPNLTLILEYIGTDVTTRNTGFDASVANPVIRQMQKDGYRSAYQNPEAYVNLMRERFEHINDEKESLYGVHFDDLEVVITPTERTMKMLEEKVQTRTFGDNIEELMNRKDSSGRPLYASGAEATDAYLRENNKLNTTVWRLEGAKEAAPIIGGIIAAGLKNPTAAAAIMAGISPSIAEALKSEATIAKEENKQHQQEHKEQRPPKPPRKEEK